MDHYVSFDHQKVGQLQGKSLTDKLNADKAPGGILMINGSQTDDVANDFRNGARAVFDARGLPILDEYYDWSSSKAQDWVRSKLPKVRGHLAGVYAANDTLAGGVIAAMKAAKIDPLPPVTGQDATLAGIQRIVAGCQYMTVYKPLGHEAEQAAEAAVTFLNGDRPKANGEVNGVPSTLLEGVAVTKDNINSTVVADGYRKVTDIYTADYAKACAAAGLS